MMTLILLKRQTLTAAEMTERQRKALAEIEARLVSAPYGMGRPNCRPTDRVIDQKTTLDKATRRTDYE
jgi:hypothetical protein